MPRSTIFDTDPDARPAKREAFSDDTVGRFHSGRQVDGVPQTLDEWRISTGDLAVAEAVAQLYGGEPIETDSTSENFIDVFTSAQRVGVILSGQDAIKDDLKLWNSGTLVHHCDGSVFLSNAREELIGQPCNCPPLLAQKKDAARAKIGPSPSIDIYFRLVDDPELGLFRFHSGSWSLMAAIFEYDDDLSRISGEALAELELETISYIAKRGPMKSKTVEYTVPKLSRIRSYNAAIAG